MPEDRLPAPLIHTAAHLLTTHHYSHRQIDTLFLRCGAPEPPPVGNLLEKVTTWLRNSPEPYRLLGSVIENFMEVQTEDTEWLGRREQMTRALATHGLAYGTGGYIIGGATGAPSRSLDSIIRERDLPAVRAEFDRALATVERDPPAAVTAACAIVESLCKGYIGEIVKCCVRRSGQAAIS